MTKPLDAESQTALPQIEQDRALINDARAKGTGPLFWAFTKLSGPGWLQSAITLGGGSLGSSLYLGVLAGFGLMWLQPLAMILGIIMLSAIGYVALSTHERPFTSINKHVSPILGWGWLLATMMANFVWCMPQFSLGTAAIQQNLAPAMLGDAAIAAEVSSQGLGEDQADEIDALTKSLKFRNNFICASILFLAGGIVILFYGSGGWGIKVFEILLKCMVGMVVLSFFAVVIKLSMGGLLDWGSILAGFIPDTTLLTHPSSAFDELLSATGSYSEYWTTKIVSEQQKVMIAAFATAVGINMTFLLPYSMLQRGWDRDFRGLAIFDLSTGLLIPFMLATGCVVIAAATQFHGKVEDGLVEIYRPSEDAPAPARNLIGDFNGILDARIAKEIGKDKMDAIKAEIKKTKDDSKLNELRRGLPDGDLRMAAALVKRDAFNLAQSLEKLVGAKTSQYLFGVGVLGMAISTIIILMLINGFAVCEMLGVPPHGWPHRIGALAAGLVGSLGPFLWSKASVWLVVPTSMFGLMLLPIAYWTFFFMMNSKNILGENMPKGLARVRWNVLMLIASGVATFGSLYSISSSKYPKVGFIVLGGFVLAVIIGAVLKSKKESPA